VSAKKGQPKARAPKAAAKRPRALTPSASTEGEHPVFCFQYAGRNADPRWAFDPSEKHARELLVFICDLARQTWVEIERAMTGSGRRHRKHHSHEVESLCPEAQRDFQRAQLAERFGEEMFRFRLSGKKRLWGFRVGSVFHVVWWDPNHQVYPTEPN
jgi:hypothetical protein